MNYRNPINELQKYIKDLNPEDCIWLAHVFNKDLIEYDIQHNIDQLDDNLINKDIDLILSNQTLNNIKSELMNRANTFNEFLCQKILNLVYDYQNNLTSREIDLSKYKKDKRLLNFCLRRIYKNLSNLPRKIDELNNNYHKLIYFIYVYIHNNNNTNPYNNYSGRTDYSICYNLNLKNLERVYFDIKTKHPSHFHKINTPDFYRWAKIYITKESLINNVLDRIITSVNETDDCAIFIESIFDGLLDDNLDSYTVLKTRITAAWYQKGYRKKNKGREHYYFLTDKALECLNILSSKYNLSKEKTIENLINKVYSEECKNNNGDDIYSTR